jgi:hypothetical protein
MSPYEYLYDQNHSLVDLYLLGTSKIQAVDHTLNIGVDILIKLKDNLVLAQNRIKQHVDQQHYECSY